MSRSILLAAAASLALAGCTAMDGMGPGPMAMAGDMTPEERTAYVRMAAASDTFEIESSRLALSRARNPAVRQFAQMLITHHTQTTQQLMASARAAGLPPPPMAMMPMQQRMMADLQRANPTNFDRRFVRQQVPAHQMALALHGNYARSGDTPVLRSTAAAAAPIVESHLLEARRLQGMVR